MILSSGAKYFLPGEVGFLSFPLLASVPAPDSDPKAITRHLPRLGAEGQAGVSDEPFTGVAYIR